MPSRPKKFIFLVQSEGRGHITQAIGLFQILVKNGHEVVHVFIGNSKGRKIPNYFFKEINTEIELLDSPFFVSDPENKSIRLGSSIIYNARFLKRYWHSLLKINNIVKKTKPDALISFYDFLGGFYNLIFRPKLFFFAVGHQFLTDHPSFNYVTGRKYERNLYLINNWLNALHAHKKLALSFMAYHPLQIKNTLVVPPILRSEIINLQPKNMDFLLGYMVYDGYSEEIIRWHQKNKEVKIHCFWDKKGEPEVKKVDDNLFFHQLNEEKFLRYMSECKGLITTAGFESVCEAMYLGKPVLMVPVSGQYEQACNAIDATLAGAGIYDDHFNISRFLLYIKEYHNISSSFKNWHNQSEEILMGALTDF